MYNLYAGDFQKADVVFITYYDTPLWQLLAPKEQKPLMRTGQGEFPSPYLAVSMLYDCDCCEFYTLQ